MIRMNEMTWMEFKAKIDEGADHYSAYRRLRTAWPPSASVCRYGSG